MRARFLLIALALLLTGCREIPDPAPGALLYVTTFDAFNDEWEQFEHQETAAIADGRLTITIDGRDSDTFAALDRTYADFDLEVEAARVEGPETAAYGVVFRLTDREHFTLFAISDDGYYGVFRRVGGKTKLLSDWALTDVLRPGMNRLRVVAQDGRFAFFVNGERMLLCPGTLWNPLAPGECLDNDQTPEVEVPVETLVTDEIAESGAVGVAALTFDEGGLTAAFDNVIVLGPPDGVFD